MSVAEAVPVILSQQSRASVANTAEPKVIPWTIWSSVTGISFTALGGIWDFAWHMSIGRDSFWMPPHMLTQLGAILIGISSVYAIRATTRSRDFRMRAVSVEVFGLQGPGGAFVALWGSLAMVASAPFDNWQHNAYGLDVTFVTPPHVLLFLGSFATMIGTNLRMAGLIHRSTEPLQKRLVSLLLVVGAIGV